MNSNCLEGMWCSHCGSKEPFRISARAWFVVHDSGTDTFDDVEWDDESACTCVNCGTVGVVKNFREEQKKIDFPDEKSRLVGAARGAKNAPNE